MEFIPAIDLIDGQSVRLVQGDFERQLNYGDPVTAAKAIERQGAHWLHLVDLDGARGKPGPNREAIKKICLGVDMMVEVGGGIRTIADAEELIDAGAHRIIIGTMAIEQPEFLGRAAERYPGKVAVGLDYRSNGNRREVALKGWVEGSGLDIFEAMPEVVRRGASAVVATDISRDGMFTGPDTDTLRALVEYSRGVGIEVIASGGISSLADLKSLKEVAFEGATLFGVISGRAIHDGRLDVGEALSICRM